MTLNPPNVDTPSKEKFLAVIDIAMQIHKQLGYGLAYAEYKTAFESSLRNSDLAYQTDRKFAVNVNGLILDHKFYTDFVIDDKIIVEVRSLASNINEEDLLIFEQMVLDKPKVCLMINFNKELLEFKRIVLPQ